MTPAALLISLALLSFGAFWIGKSRSLAIVGGHRGVRNLHSLPSHYGLMTAMWCALPALAVIGLWLMFQDAIILRGVTDHLPAVNLFAASVHVNGGLNGVCGARNARAASAAGTQRRR